MNQIRNKTDPSHIEVHKYVRYMINKESYTAEEVLDELADWPLEKVETAIKDVERENSKPRPKRYYVSLKEPLEERF